MRSDGIGGNPVEVKDNENYLHLFNLKAPYGYERYGIIRLMVYFPIFWVWIFLELWIYRPKCVHACDLATVLPCYLYKLLFRRKLVFDILDRYAMTYVPKNRNVYSRSLHFLVNLVEEGFARNSDVLLAVSDKIFQTFRKKPRKCVTIMNCPEDKLMNRSKIGSKCFRLLFTGAIRSGRGLETIANIMLELSDVEFAVTGKIKDTRLHDKISKIPNIRYHGFFER